MTPEGWTAQRLGKAVVLLPAAGAHGRVQTWLVQAGDEPLVAVLRWGLARRKFAQECTVAEHLWPRLDAAPVLLAKEQEHGALLRTALPGVAGVTEPAAVAAAARAVAALHGVPVADSDAVSLADAVALRAAAAARQLPAEPLVANALQVVDEGRPFEGALRCWCHRDLQPANWVWNGQTVGLVDWEHSRLDAPELDLAHLVSTTFWASFRRHYGEVDDARIRAAVALHGLVTLAWGCRHADRSFVQRGRAVLLSGLDRRMG